MVWAPLFIVVMVIHLKEDTDWFSRKFGREPKKHIEWSKGSQIPVTKSAIAELLAVISKYEDEINNSTLNSTEKESRWKHIEDFTDWLLEQRDR